MSGGWGGSLVSGRGAAARAWEAAPASGTWVHPPLHLLCRASRLAALGLLRGARERWLDRLAELDGLVACLGLPAVHALLMLAPSATAAAAMAEAAVQAAGGGSGKAQEGSSSRCQERDTETSSSTGGGSSGGGEPTAGVLEDLASPRLDPRAAAAAAGWWFRHLRSAAVPVKTVQALQARGLGCLLLSDYCQ